MSEAEDESGLDELDQAEYQFGRDKTRWKKTSCFVEIVRTRKENSIKHLFGSSP